MTGFPNVPLIRGDTDDDASIHLHTHVGPARPMTKANYDRQIMEILNRRMQISEEEHLLELEDLNAEFEHFSKGRRVSYSDNEDTEVEDAPAPKSAPQAKKSKTPKKKETHSRPVFSFADMRFLGFVVGIVALLLLPLPTYFNVKSANSAPQDLSGLNARVDLVEQRVLALDDISKALSDQTDLLESKQEAFFAGVNHKLAEVSGKFDSMDGNLVQGQLAKLRSEFDIYKEKLDNIEVVNDLEKLEANITSISRRLAQLLRVNSDIISFKEDMLRSFTEKLPELVPVYIKNGKIHYLPEFQNFLHAFVDKFAKKSSPELNDLASKLETNLKRQSANDIKNALTSYVTREELQNILRREMAETNAAVSARFNSLLDRIDFSGNITRIDVESSNRVMLDNLVDVVSKGSVKMNFADYKNGARILGFLTTTGRDTYKQKPFLRKLFLGWYDYLDSNGLRSPKNLKFDANNILVDKGSYWLCESNRCSFGVRLSSPVILTDLIFKNPPQPVPRVTLPVKASIYIKPAKSQVSALEEYLGRVKPDFLRAGKENKYLTKFYKVQDVDLHGRAVEHIKLPVSLVNMKILVRDIYIEIASLKGTTGLYNLKAYGLTEFNSLAYAEEFESILDGLNDDNQPEYYFDDGGRALGDDDYV